MLLGKVRDSPQLSWWGWGWGMGARESINWSRAPLRWTGSLLPPQCVYFITRFVEYTLRFAQFPRSTSSHLQQHRHIDITQNIYKHLDFYQLINQCWHWRIKLLLKPTASNEVGISSGFTFTVSVSVGLFLPRYCTKCPANPLTSRYLPVHYRGTSVKLLFFTRQWYQTV